MYHTQIGHVHLKVRDLEQAVTFYTRFLGLREVERVGNQYVFLTGGALHHEVALQNVGPHAPLPHPRGTGLYHTAFAVADRRSLAEAYAALLEAGVSVAAVDHLISWAIYFNDPDGNGLEIYCDTRSDPGGAPLWRGRNLPLSDEQLYAALQEESASVPA